MGLRYLLLRERCTNTLICTAPSPQQPQESFNIAICGATTRISRGAWNKQDTQLLFCCTPSLPAQLKNGFTTHYLINSQLAVLDTPQRQESTVVLRMRNHELLQYLPLTDEVPTLSLHQHNLVYCNSCPTVRVGHQAQT